MSARDRILQKLFGASSAGQPPHNLQKNGADAARPVGAPAFAPLDVTTAAATAATRLHSLRTALEAAHAEVHLLKADQIGTAILTFCARRQLRTLMLPGGELPFALPENTAALQISRFDRPIEAHKDSLFNDIDAGLTIADCAIADTGTLVMSSSPEQPRTLSLVPPIHLCLLNLNRLHGTLSAALQAECWAQAMPSNLIFISGPSKTADIQQTLAYGAHGPKELVVFLIDGGVQ